MSTLMGRVEVMMGGRGIPKKRRLDLLLSSFL
jgi:hypothetical protein